MARSLSREALKKLNELQVKRLSKMHEAYVKKYENNENGATLRAGINSYLTALQDAGLITQAEWRVLFIYFTL